MNEGHAWGLIYQLIPIIIMAIVGGWVRGMMLGAKVEIIEAIERKFVTKEEFEGLEDKVIEIREDFRDFRKGKI
jgi:hypothetical protein